MALQKLIDDETQLLGSYKPMKDYAGNNLTWQSIIPVLHKKLIE
jgi:hypothetical protein